MKHMCVSETRGHIKRYVGYKDCEGYSIAVVVPGKPSGGVKQTIDKIIRGLSLEGFCVKQLKPHVKTILNETMFDIKNIRTLRTLRELDAVIYMGSIPLPSHVFISNHVKTILFVHGFVKDELLNAIKRGNLWEKAGATYFLGLWGLSRTINKIDLFICRCLTSCEANKIWEKFILLPEFVFPEEVVAFEELIKKHRRDYRDRDNSSGVKILTYTSYAESPRLLKLQYVEHLIKHVSRQVKKEIELLIIDPRRGNETTKLAENLIVRYLKPLPKEMFYKYAMNADLFIELCIDEELRNTTIEVALLETPVAKLTHPRFVGRQDYSEDDLLQGYSFKNLVDLLVEYLSNIEYYKSYYVKNLKNFILKHRTWDAVKSPLINHIKGIK